MILISLLMLVVGLGFSAFFSGTETGFYRVAKVRLIMDAKSGNWISLALLWLANHTSVIVATILIGNNLANYLISLAFVLLSSQMFSESNRLQALVPVVATPLIFVYGELMPKLLFFQTPYRLLRLGSPLMILCTILFLPISVLVLGYEALWSYWSGGSRTNLGYSLGKQEIQRALMESQAAGVVIPLQREMAENLFTYGGRPIRQFAVPVRAIALVDSDAARTQALAAATRANSSIIGVMQGLRMMGCCLASDLRLDLSKPGLPLLPVCEVSATDHCIHVLTRMQAMHAPLAQVIDAGGRVMGVVTRERLTSLMIAD